MSWEYKTVGVKVTDVAAESFDERLNALGNEGWELAATVVHEHHGYSTEVHFVFKRPRPESP
ncbi:MAG: hypothetical protein JWM74_1910 [Myxococcaceae bacterium]|nr:hypothetical protein [Myxococcaceae bacterium]